MKTLLKQLKSPVLIVKEKKNRPDGNKAEWNLVTRKDIKAGEELTLEYNLYKPD